MSVLQGSVYTAQVVGESDLSAATVERASRPFRAAMRAGSTTRECNAEARGAKSTPAPPQIFALSHPYLLAFEPNFIEIRHLETAALVHIITAKNIRMLHSSTREVSPKLRQAPFQVNFQLTARCRYCTLTKMRAVTISLRV